MGLRILFVIQLLVAATMLLIGFLVAVRPYLLLDVVLTPQELSDPAVYDSTLALLKTALGRNAVWWFVFGGVVAGLAIAGLCQSRQIR